MNIFWWFATLATIVTAAGELYALHYTSGLVQ